MSQQVKQPEFEANHLVPNLITFGFRYTSIFHRFFMSCGCNKTLSASSHKTQNKGGLKTCKNTIINSVHFCTLFRCVSQYKVYRNISVFREILSFILINKLICSPTFFTIKADCFPPKSNEFLIFLINKECVLFDPGNKFLYMYIIQINASIKNIDSIRYGSSNSKVQKRPW